MLLLFTLVLQLFFCFRYGKSTTPRPLTDEDLQNFLDILDNDDDDDGALTDTDIEDGDSDDGLSPQR